MVNPDQYDNDLVSYHVNPSKKPTSTDQIMKNWKSHMRWTGPQILEQLPEINLICAGMGTSGMRIARLGSITMLTMRC